TAVGQSHYGNFVRHEIFNLLEGEMKFRMPSILSAVVTLIAATAVAGAAEVRVLSGGNMATILDALKGDFEKSSGHKLTIAYATAGEVRNRIQSGEAADVVVVLRSFLDELIKAEKVNASSLSNI